MIHRRKFIRNSTLGSAAILLPGGISKTKSARATAKKPLVISTWPNLKANAAAWNFLADKKSALDAVEAGVRIPEADPADTSVGYGGLPDRDGRVTLDACIMTDRGDCGSVMALEHIMHPISVARLVMEKTPHVQLVGEGALQFALSQGFTKENLLTPQAEKAWKEWLKRSGYDPMHTVNESMKMGQPGAKDNHDTIGMLAIDAIGGLAGACTTSGLAYKMRGRVGDSPIIGAGLFVDAEAGAATATGVGEEVVRVCGAHTIVEMMRHGHSPEKACREAVSRIVKRYGKKAKEIQVGFIAMSNRGEYGAFSITKGFSYAVRSEEGEKVGDAPAWF